MNIVLLTSDYHLSANMGVESFLTHPGLKKHDIHVVGMVVASTFDFNAKGFRSAKSFIQKTGLRFFLKNIILQTLKRLLIGFARWFIPNKHRHYRTLDEIARYYNIPTLHVGDINNIEALNFVREKHPDYLASCFLIQICKKEMLEIPIQGALNVHPALTQNHRGVFTAFWALVKNWKRSGATVHFMTKELDGGEIILQKRFLVHPSDTIYAINEKSARLGGQLLAKALVKVKKRKAGKPLKKFGLRFKMPTRKDVYEFYKKGKSSMRWRELFRI